MVGERSESSSISVEDLHKIGDEEALALVETHLGNSSIWKPELVRFRLEHDSQRDWRIEVGNLLHVAQKYGYLPALIRGANRARKVHAKYAGRRDPNDKSHLDLMAALAPAMAVHYLVGTGWGFSEWEPKRPPMRDVDVELVAPSGQLVALQVKAPDQPGLAEAPGRWVADGGHNDRVILAAEHARDQLAGATQPSMITISSQRSASLASSPESLLTRLVGPTTDIAGMNLLPRDELGCFYCEAWRDIGALVLLDHLRGSRSLYACTVLLNPAADPSVRCAREWFPRSRVCWFDGEQFHWQGGHPTGQAGVREGTKIVTPWWYRGPSERRVPAGADMPPLVRR